MGNASRIPENLGVYDLNMFMIRTHMLGDSQFIYWSLKSVLSVCSANTSGNFVCERQSFPHGGWTAKTKDVPLLSEPCILPVLGLVSLQYVNSSPI